MIEPDEYELLYGIPVNEKWTLETAIKRGLCPNNDVGTYGLNAMNTILDEIAEESGIEGLTRSAIWINGRDIMFVWVFPVQDFKKPRTKEAIEKLEKFKTLAHVDRNPSVWYSAHGMVPDWLEDVTEVHPNFSKLRVPSFENYKVTPVRCAASSCLKFN